MNDDLYAWIEDYNLGRLASPQLEQFESAMANDAVLSAAVQANRMEWEAQEFFAENLVRAQIRKAFLEQPKGPRFWFLKNWKWIVPAILLLGIAGTFFYMDMAVNTPIPLRQPDSSLKEDSIVQPAAPVQSREHDSVPIKKPMADLRPRQNIRQIAINAYHVPESVSVLRGVNSTDTLTLASKAFAQKNYSLVLALLTSLPSEDRQTALSLRAHANFATGNYPDAARDFAELESGTIYRREAQWFGILSRIAMPDSDKNEWLKPLDAIRQQPKHPYQKEATALWKRVHN